MSPSTWATTQLSQLLPLDQDSLTQIIDYTSALPKDDAAEHLKNLLGDSPKALEFISSFNARRDAPNTAPSAVAPAPALPEGARKLRKKKAPLNNLPPPRHPEDYGNTLGAYQKKKEEDYMGGSKRPHPEPTLAKTLALSDQPDARQLPKPTPANPTPAAKPPPSASGHLISDLPNVRSDSRTSSRTSSPAPKTKINVAGGNSMHGASTTLQDLVRPPLPFQKPSINQSQDSAIRALELQTNSSLSADPSHRRCTCLATRHPLLAAAPNCLNCGKIICVKEGIGPCTFCGYPLLSSQEITAMIDSLRQERGQEKMNLNNASHRRADLASAPRPFTDSSAGTSTPSSSSITADKTLDLAKQHRDKLLAYQAENARRTHIIDEAADFETPTSGLSMWSSPVERAAQLKRQQKVLREQEWNAKPEYEKRRVVVSVDLVGGKVVRRMAEVKRPEAGEEEMGEEVDTIGAGEHAGGDGGAFSKNPLLGSLIRPVWNYKGKDTDRGQDESKENLARKSAWRRVQDDNDDNEAWILDGGIYGGQDNERRLGNEEHAQG
ncbi:MAG: hypothetical protein ASARMPREDX12_008994 [Alectoria sarmentosa]|nr:MAG: hypothetical protein ASARMPREDX12_008994 [Alectoria sarmentosa]